MHDPVDIRRRIDRRVTPLHRRDDYGQLLARGQVVHRLKDVEDIETWRAQIRRQARADKIKVRTGFNDGIVWAIRARADRPEWHAEARRYRGLLSRAVPLAVELRHEPTLAARDGDELVCTCGRCSALGYGNAAEDIVGGVLFDASGGRAGRRRCTELPRHRHYAALLAGLVPAKARLRSQRSGAGLMYLDPPDGEPASASQNTP
jgi:hypothetical protein